MLPKSCENVFTFAKNDVDENTPKAVGVAARVSVGHATVSCDGLR